jgi:hypothetical protein
VEGIEQVQSCEITPARLFLKAVTPRLTMDVKVGDPVQAGLVVSNSEVGLGSVRIEPMLYRLSCLNGAIVADAGVRKFHVGRGGNGDLDGAVEFYRDETRALDDRAFWNKVRDVAVATITPAHFERIVHRYREAAGVKIDGNPVEVVEATAKRFGLVEAETGGVLRFLAVARRSGCRPHRNPRVP